MPRDLRPRRTRQSYTNLFHSEDEGEKEPGPSQQREHDNGSDFATPAVHEEAAHSDEDGSGDDGIGNHSSIRNDLGTGIDSGSEMDTPHSKKKKSRIRASQGKAKSKSTKAKGKQKASQVTPSPAPTPATRQSTTTTAPPTPALQTAPPHVTAPSTRHSYALPNPNVHHRHRPVPLFAGPTASARALLTAATSSTATAVRVERLQHPPRLFAPNETVPTNAYASSASITRRVGKAWSASVGAGPVWQIVEDMGWFREAEQFLNQGGAVAQAASESGSESGSGQALARQVVVCDERARRPRVHADVALLEGWSLFRRVECVFLLSSSPPLSPSILFLFFPASCRSSFVSAFFGILHFIDSVFVFFFFRDAIAYMPTDQEAGGSVSGPDVPVAPAPAAAPPVSCDFGPFGEQTRVDLETLDTQRLCKSNCHPTTLVQSPARPFASPGTDPIHLLS